LPDGSLRHHSLKIDEEKLDEILKQWRYNLEDYATQRYLETSWWLYDSMFRPFASELASLNPSAIVFIGDRFFRNVPLDALHDGEQFLIEKYPLATTLGLQFSNFTENKGVKPSLILGLTIEKPPFDKLEFAQVEADRVAAILPKAKKLLDRDFTKERLTTELKKFTELSTLHLITHSNFAGTLEKSFLQTYDGKISLTELENFWINGEVAVNLVVLSACQTASGNSRSILGLAGVAVRGNAQAVIGSLWFINDEQASELMTYFYQNLYEGKVSKAVALQQAKIQLIKSSPDKQHPLFWSTLILVGNWL
jgi:CHAT domain-containing protein